MRKGRHISIQAKMLMAAFVYMCFIVTSLYIFLPQLLRSQQVKEFEDGLAFHTEAIAEKIGGAFSGSRPELSSTIEEFVKNSPELTSVDVVNWTGARIASWPDDFSLSYDREKDGMVTVGGKFAVYGKPILSDNVVVAYVYVSQSMSTLDRAVDTLRAEIIIISLLVLIVSLLIAFHLSSLITQPLEELSRATKRLAGGDYTARADISTRDEVGLLAHHFNRMASLIESGKEELEEAIFLAESATKAKSQFLATMSHEIRSPLNGIIGMSRILLKTDMTEEQKEYAETVAGSGDVLLSVINEVLDFSKIESGQMDLENRPFDLRKSIRAALSTQKFAATEKHLLLTSSIDPDIPPEILADETRLRQIVINLISNAIKFTSTGSVSLSVTMKSPGREEADIIIAVSDTGVGIDADGMEKLFKSFSQADESITRRFGGTGLGLAISKRIAEMMGGTMWAESVPGEGSTFYARVQIGLIEEECGGCESMETESDQDAPVLYEHATDIGAESETDGTDYQVADAGECPPERRILLVEDNAINQRVAKLMLESIGYSVDTADCGRTAIQAARHVPYGVILMDLRMPDMSGLDATTEIRTEWKWDSPLRVIAVTADVTLEKKHACEAIGMIGFIPKPITEEALEAVIANALATDGSIQESGNVDTESDLHQEPEHIEPDSEPRKAYESNEILPKKTSGPFATDRDPVAIVRRFLGEDDPEMITDVLKEFVADAEAMVSEVRNGVDEGDFVVAGRAAHSLKSTAAMLGFDTLSLDCRAIERICDHSPEEDLSDHIDHLNVHLRAMKRHVRRSLGGEAEA